MVERIQWLDTAKGYGIIFVILGHLGIPILGSWIYSFHMPLFFFLAGYVHKEERSLGKFLNKKIKRLIVPYIILGSGIIVFNIMWSVFGGSFSLKEVLRQLNLLIIRGRFLELWFIPCLFLTSVICFFIEKMKLQKISKLGVVIFINILILFYYYKGGENLIWNIDTVMVSILFYYIGYLFRIYHIEDYLKKENNIYLLYFLVVNLTCNYLTYYFTGKGLEMYNRQYGQPLFSYLSAFGGIFFIILLSKKQTPLILRYIGKNSLIYFGWHTGIFFPLTSILIQHGLLYDSKLMYFILAIFLGTIVSQVLIILKTRCKCISKILPV